MQGLAGATRPPPHPLGLCRNARYPGDLQRPHLCPVSLSVPVTPSPFKTLSGPTQRERGAGPRVVGTLAPGRLGWGPGEEGCRDTPHPRADVHGGQDSLGGKGMPGPHPHAQASSCSPGPAAAADPPWTLLGPSSNALILQTDQQRLSGRSLTRRPGAQSGSEAWRLWSPGPHQPSPPPTCGAAASGHNCHLDKVQFHHRFSSLATRTLPSVHAPHPLASPVQQVSLSVGLGMPHRDSSFWGRATRALERTCQGRDGGRFPGPCASCCHHCHRVPAFQAGPGMQCLCRAGRTHLQPASPQGSNQEA